MTLATGSELSGWVRRKLPILLIVVLPSLLAILYFGLIASDQYVSESRFVIKTPTQKPSSSSVFANLVQTTTGAGGSDSSREVLSYIKSRDALADLQKRVDVRSYFHNRGADPLSAYPAFGEDRFENLYRYYNDMVSARLDKDGNVAVLEVRGFTAADAHRMNAELLLLSEDLVNKLNTRAHQKAITESEQRVLAAKAQLRAASEALAQYRNSSVLIDPAKQATGELDVSYKLRAEQAALQAQIEQTRAMAPRSPLIPALEGRLAAMSRQLGEQNGRVMGGPDTIASKITGYDKVALDKELAAQSLSAATLTAEQARTEAQNQQYYLERLVEPNTPDLALYPKRLRSIVTVIAALLSIYLVGWMLVVGVLEHAPED